MFTIEQIRAAHAKVKSGADFPRYIRDIRALGVKGYETYVADGHSEFHGESNDKVSGEAKYEILVIAPESNLPEFRKGLVEHQQGKTDYSTFCRMCAASGVEKWTVDTDAMNCSYYNKSGETMLVETIGKFKP